MNRNLAIPFDVQARGIGCVAFYCRLIDKGESPKMAEMLALRQPPRCLTDDVFMEGWKNGEQFGKDPRLGDMYAADLRAAGGSPAGKYYIGQLADYPGDPKAWVSSMGDVRQRCLEKGWACSGGVNLKRNRDCVRDEPEDLGIADDIIDAEVGMKMRNNPELAPTPKERERLWQETKELRTPHWAKGKEKQKKPKKKKGKVLSIGP